MTQDKHLIEQFVSSKEIYRGTIVDVSIDTVTLPNQKQATREVVRHCAAVCILATTPDDKVVLVRQYRYPTAKVLLEVPAGKIDHDGDTPESCALRELSEETPYTTKSVELLQEFYTAPGFCDELMYLYRARDIVADSEAQPDDDEFVETVMMSRDEVKQALKDRSIEDAKTLVALQAWLLE